MIVCSYGGGVNSTALLVEAVRRGARPDLILFADTGDERPDTYAYITTFSDWLRDRGFPTVETVRWIRRDGTFVPLGQWCRDGKTLPSKAFGFSGCTSKWKQQPMDKRVKSDSAAQAEWAAGRTVERWIGYDADEPERWERMLRAAPELHLFSWHSPLIDWDMGRDECVEAIRSAGLTVPGKSSCYFCPSMRKPEIDRLGAEYPDLLRSALEMEDAAMPGLVSVKGLGRSFNWRQHVQGQRTDCEVIDQDCGCYDGSAALERQP